MSEKYPIYRLDIGWMLRNIPVDGAIDKKWYLHPELGRCLFKIARSKILRVNVDWTEKVVYELAERLNLPVARSELATGYIQESAEPIDGIISLDYLPSNIDREIPGRRFLMEIDNLEQSDRKPYTIERVIDILDRANVLPPSSWSDIGGIDTGAKLYIGYMLLDTLVANTDRHDRNWGVMSVEDRLELIPTYDHGYSLGVHLEDAAKSIASLERFAIETPSDFRDSDRDLYMESERVLCRDVFASAAKLAPKAAKIWQQQLAQIIPVEIAEIIDRIPSDRITPTSANFAKDLITYNRHQILSIEL